MRLINVNKATTFIFTKYSDYINNSSSILAMELLKYTSINNYAIKLKKINSHFMVQSIA